MLSVQQVRADVVPSRVYLEYDLHTAANNVSAGIRIGTTDATLLSQADGYNIWQLELTPTSLAGSASQLVNIAVDVGEEKIITDAFVAFRELNGHTC